MPTQCLSQRGNVTITSKMFTTDEGVFDLSWIVLPNFLKPNIIHVVIRYTVVSYIRALCFAPAIRTIWYHTERHGVVH